MDRMLVSGLIAVVWAVLPAPPAHAQELGGVLPPRTVAEQSEAPTTAAAATQVAVVAPPRAPHHAHVERPANALLIAGLTTTALGALAVGLGLGFFAVAHPVLATTVDSSVESMPTSTSELRGLAPVIVGGILDVIGATAVLVGLVMTVVGWACPPGVPSS